MKFYLDFEATRFSNRIISIGCVSQDGKTTFSTLVKPYKEKVDTFITKLTGITNEMLEEAPSADEAFLKLLEFIEMNNYNAPPEYYVYGNCDIDFLKYTMKDMVNTRACMFVQSIIGGLVDYAPSVKKFFSADHDIALRKVYMLIKSQQAMIQHHDALEDAMMLQEVVENLDTYCKPEDKELLMAMPAQKKPSLKECRAPECFIKWNESDAQNADTGADENNYLIKAIDSKNRIKYFKDLETAALWVIKFHSRGYSPKNQEHITKIKNAIRQNTNQDAHRAYDCFWSYNNIIYEDASEM